MLRIVGSLLLAFGIFGIWFVFHIRSKYADKGANRDIFLLFLFPIIIIIGTGIKLTFNYHSALLDDVVYLIAPLAWFLTFVIYMAFFTKKKDSQKDKGQ